MNKDKPDCYECVHRMEVPGSAHSRCNNFQAQVQGNRHGIVNGWFKWPFHYDPTWLESCDGFSVDEKDRKLKQEGNPLSELLAMLR